MRTLLVSLLAVSFSASAFANTCGEIFYKIEETSARRGGSQKKITDESLVEMIAYLDSVGLTVHTYAMNKDPGGKLAEALKQRFGYTAQAASLLRTGINRFGTWDEVLKRAQVDSAKYAKREWSEELTQKLLLELQKQGVDVRNAKFVLDDPRTEPLMERLRGEPFKVNSLYAYIYRTFGGWEKMLAKFGMEKVNTQDSAQLLTMLKEISDMGVRFQRARAVLSDPRV